MRIKTDVLLTILLSLVLAACGEQKGNVEPSIDNTDANEAITAKANGRSDYRASSAIKLLINGNIYTVNQTQPHADAIAIQDGKIIAVGSSDQILAAYPKAQRDNLNGATVIPGFIDAHGHLLGLGYSLLNVDLMGTTSKADIIARLRASAGELSDGQWLIGRGWDQNDWPEKTLPNKQDLDAAFPSRPVWLERVDGHAGWANSAAMAFAERDLSGDWQVDGGEIIRDENQIATGVFIDKAASLIEQKVPAANSEQLTKALKLAMQKTASVGLTSVHDAGTSLTVWQLLKQLEQRNDLNIRVYAMADGAQEMLDYLCKNGQQLDDSAMLTARAIKLYSDGALGSRGAALLSDYSDAPGNKGLLIESQETLGKYASKAANCGLQVNIHAIGDRGNRVTLDVLEQVSDAINNPGRHRIEHAQVIAPDDFDRYKELGLIASVQPTHATSDMYWAEERVGAERIKGAYAWQTFNSLGIPLALGSDFPVELPDPLHGFYAAIARQDHKGWPASGWYPEQKLSREQALYGFTLGAAYAAFQEDQLGSIEVGKYADFTLLSKDIMQIPESEILQTQVIATYINGEAVFTIAQ